MPRLAMFAVGFLGLLAIPAQLLAAPSWCAVNHSGAIMCEDWDRYCPNPPTDQTEACPDYSGQGWDTLFGKDWRTGGSGCVGLSVEDHWFSSAPYAGRMASKGDLGATYLSLSPYIMKKFGNDYTQIMATDTAPIVLESVIDGAAGKLNTANIYVEIAASTKQPLVDYIVSDICANKCVATDPGSFPIICRQSPSPTSSVGTCPPIATAPILPSIAAGELSFLDTNPCHCEGNDHFPQVGHLSVFDGKQWWTLTQDMFPDTFQGQGDFKLYARSSNTDGYGEPGKNHVRLTINSTEIFVELMKVTLANPQAEYSWCKIPRQYTGPFAVYNFGYAEPCRLKNNGNWECATIRQCVNSKLGFTLSVDNIVINGGIGYEAPGACCITHESERTIECVPANGGMDCSQTYGGTFKGRGTVCAEVPCCPPFAPDHDMDGDVDLEDFGWFQTCLSSAQFADPPSVPCQCANLDGDVDVDTGDFEIFARCLTGPGIPANSNCIN